MNKEQCKHKPIRSDLVDTPTINDLAYAELKGQLKIGDFS